MKIKNYLIALTLVFAINIIGNAQTSVTVGEKAPEINITHWIENAPEDKSLEGKCIVLEFWATWCGPCIEAVPHLNELKEQFDPNEIMFLSMTDETAEMIERVLQRIDFRTAVVSDDSERTHAGYGRNGEPLRSIPKTILIDKNGIVQWIGLPRQLEKNMLDSLIKGKPIQNIVNGKGTNAPRKPVKITYEVIEEANSDFPEDTEQKKNSVIGPTSNTLNFREATEKYQIVNSGNGKMKYTNISLRDIYVQVFNQGGNEIDIPSELNGRRYSFDFTYDEEKDYLMILEQEILTALNLNKTETTTSATGVKLIVTDKTKLEKTLYPDYSRNSGGLDVMLVNGVTLEEFGEILKGRMKGNYVIESSDTDKYDFVLKVSSQSVLLESLKGYGISSEVSEMDIKKVKLTFKE